MVNRTLEYLKIWDNSNEADARAQGWTVVGGIIRRNISTGRFQSDYDALQFVRAAEERGSIVAKKALKLHMETNLRRAAADRKRIQRQKPEGGMLQAA